MKLLRKLELRRELWQAKRRLRFLQADYAEMSYDSSPDSFPIWYKQEWEASFQPMRDAIREEEENIRRIEEELTQP